MTCQQKIQEALDSSILDWNRPSQLNSISKDVIYPPLTRTIERLIDEEVVAELEFMLAVGMPIEGTKSLIYSPEIFSSRIAALKGDTND